MKNTLMKIAILWLAWLCAVPAALAYQPYTRSPVDNLVTAPVTLSTGDTILTTWVYIGEGSVQGCEWSVTVDPTSTTPSLNIQVLQSNYPLTQGSPGPFNLWSSTTLAGSTVTNNLTATTEIDGTDLKLTPSRYAKFLLTNTTNTTETVNFFRSFNQ
jgi:hypothetical protein